MAFRKYLAKRIGTALLALYIALTINFLIFRVFAPISDPTELIMAPEFPEWRKAELRAMWGLNRSYFEQYIVYIINLATWQYGDTFTNPPEPVVAELRWRLVNSLSLMLSGTILSTVVGIALGVLAASKRGSKLDVFITSTGVFSRSIPTFFIQILFIIALSYYLGWFPSVGVVDARPHTGFLDLLLDKVWHAALPIITLTVAGFGFWAMYTRNLMVDILTEDYITTARATGVKNRVLLFNHAFRAILPQVATVMITLFPLILTGSVITEMLFSWPGIGQWYLEALLSGNHPVTQAITWNYMFISVMGFLLLDIMYGFLDPRIRVGVRR